MESISDDSSSSPERLNYFNYFTEVEEEFVRRRGKPMLISPIDWALVESWKNADIPLHIVLRAINQAFDAYDARGHKYRKINSIFYCQQEVEVTFAEYRVTQVGGEQAADQPSQTESEKVSAAPVTEQAAFPKELILDFLARCEGELRVASSRASTGGRTETLDAIERARARLKEIISEVESSTRVQAEALECDLDAIDRMILDNAAKSYSDDVIQEIRAEAEAQLRSYRKRMDKGIYEQTVKNFIARRLRELNNIPRLSLFYL